MKRLPPQDLLRLFQALHHLLSAGLDLVTALELQGQQQALHHASLKQVVSALKTGKTFHEALTSAIFLPRVIHMYLRQSEDHGDCALACQLSSSWLRDQLAWKNMVKQLSFYPLLLMITSLALLIIMLKCVLPEFASLYHTLEVPLPPVTGWLLQLGNQANLIVFSLLFVSTSMLVFLYLARRHETIAYLLEKTLTRSSILNQVIQLHHQYQFSLQLGTLLHSGCTLLRALDIMRQSAKSLIFKHYLAQSQQHISTGLSLSQALCHGIMADQTFKELIMLAEKTGRLDALLLNLANQHKEKSLSWQEQAKHLIQPCITLLLGIFLAGWILLLYYPMLQLGTTLG